MVIYLRNEQNHTVVDIEVWEKSEWLSPTKRVNYVEVKSSVIIGPYSHILMNNVDKNKVINVFAELSQLRGWFWESYKKTENKEPRVSDVVKAIHNMLVPIAKEFKLNIVQD